MNIYIVQIHPPFYNNPVIRCVFTDKQEAILYCNIHKGNFLVSQWDTEDHQTEGRIIYTSNNQEDK